MSLIRFDLYLKSRHPDLSLLFELQQGLCIQRVPIEFSSHYLQMGFSFSKTILFSVSDCWIYIFSAFICSSLIVSA